MLRSWHGSPHLRIRLLGLVACLLHRQYRMIQGTLGRTSTKTRHERARLLYLVADYRPHLASELDQ
jgi:hypothetical protein